MKKLIREQSDFKFELICGRWVSRETQIKRPWRSNIAMQAENIGRVLKLACKCTVTEKRLI